MYSHSTHGTMLPTKHCSGGLCQSDSTSCDKDDMKRVTSIPFVKPNMTSRKVSCSSCRWSAEFIAWKCQKGHTHLFQTLCWWSWANCWASAPSTSQSLSDLFLLFTFGSEKTIVLLFIYISVSILNKEKPTLAWTVSSVLLLLLFFFGVTSNP